MSWSGEPIGRGYHFIWNLHVEKEPDSQRSAEVCQGRGKSRGNDPEVTTGLVHSRNRPKSGSLERREWA